MALQIDAFQHMQHFVQGMQQQAQHAIAAEDQQHKQEVHKLMARSVFSGSTVAAVNEAFSQKAFQHVTEGKAKQKKKDGLTPFSCFSFRVLCMLAHCRTVLKQNGAIVNLITTTCTFPTMTVHIVFGLWQISSVYMPFHTLADVVNHLTPLCQPQC